jgi:hypothetical protein
VIVTLRSPLWNGKPGQDSTSAGLPLQFMTKWRQSAGLFSIPARYVTRRDGPRLPVTVPTLRNRRSPVPPHGASSLWKGRPKDGLIAASPKQKAPAERYSTEAGYCRQTAGTPSSSCRLAQFERLRGHGLLMVKAAAKSKRRCDDDGASQKDAHG